jgi:hypothetical protein
MNYFYNTKNIDTCYCIIQHDPYPSFELAIDEANRAGFYDIQQPINNNNPWRKYNAVGLKLMRTASQFAQLVLEIYQQDARALAAPPNF